MKINFFRTDLSQDITSYDLLKTFAIVTMLIDHVGIFFYPDIEEFRLIGRLSMPVWFFLIGYAQHKKLELRLWIWGFILLMGTGWMKDWYNLLPLNILFTFLLTRAVLDYVMIRAVKNFDALFGVFWLCILLIIPGLYFFEYSSYGFLFAAAGYLARHQKNITTISPQQTMLFMAMTTVTYTIGMAVMFKFDIVNTGFLSVLLLCECLCLLFFTRQTYPFTGVLPNTLKYILFLTGRRTLEVYVLHFLTFMYISLHGF
jgi:hypothetical protein